MGAVGGRRRYLCYCPQAKKVLRSRKEKLPAAKAGDDAPAALAESWLVFSGKIKPKISKALLDLASFNQAGNSSLPFW